MSTGFTTITFFTRDVAGVRARRKARGKGPRGPSQGRTAASGREAGGGQNRQHGWPGAAAAHSTAGSWERHL